MANPPSPVRKASTADEMAAGMPTGNSEVEGAGQGSWDHAMQAEIPHPHVIDVDADERNAVTLG